MKSIARNDRRTHTQLFSLNLIRAVAIVMVVLDHSLHDDLSPDAVFFIKLLLNPGAMLFFMISGALLMPVTGSYSHFIRHRVVKVFVPYVVWVLFYAFAYYWLGMINEYTLAMQIRWSWLSFNFWPGWFVPIIMSLYFVMPLISPWIATASRRHFHYVLIVWLAASILPLIQPLAGFRIAYTPGILFLSAVPFAITGYYLTYYRNRQPLLPAYVLPVAGEGGRPGAYRRWIRRRKLVGLYALMVTISIVLPFLFRNAIHSFDFRKLCMDWTALPGVVLAIFYFSLLVRVTTLGPVTDKVVNFISRYSYGIYLSHALLHILQYRYAPEYASSTLVSFAVGFGGGIAVSWLLRRIPFLGKYMV